MDNVLPLNRHSRSVGPGEGTRPVQVIAVAAGKGGVGKTTISINLALSLARLGRKAMLLDADLGLANIDTLLGLQPRRNLSHVLAGECSLSDVVMQVCPGVQLVPAASGIARMADLTPQEQAGIIGAFDELTDDLDVLIVDSAPGITPSTLQFVRAAHRVVVVVCDEPASITDAYAMIKVLSRDHGIRQFSVLVNKTDSADQAASVFNKISRVADRFLDVALTPIGEIPRDTYVQRSIQEQVAVVTRFPGSLAARSFQALARKALAWPLPAAPRGDLEFFVERTVTSSAGDAGP